MRNASIALLVTLLLAGVQFRDAESKKMQLEEVRSAIKNLKTVCMEHSGASSALVENARVAEVYPNDRKLQCYNKCILSMMKGMKENKLREKVMLQQADLMLVDEVAGPVKAIISACIAEVTSTDACEVAWQFTKCYYEKDRSLAFF